jgi:hypothetical protein
MIHLVLVRAMSPLLLLLLLSAHLLLNKDYSCLALRFTNEHDTFDWEALLDKEAAAKKHLISVNERPPANKKELDYLTSLDRDTRKPNQLIPNDNAAGAGTNNLPDDDGNHGFDEPWLTDTGISRTERLQSNAGSSNTEQNRRRSDVLFLVIVGTSTLVGILGLVAAAIFWYKIHKKAETAIDAEYPSYGVTGPGTVGSKVSPSSTLSDRKLAQSAQMFHYQQQRQQMMAQEKTQFDAKPVHSDESDDEAPAGGDYTVYECPGLAPTGEMEVRNPLFSEPDSSLTSSTSASHPATNNHYPQLSTMASSSSPPKEKSLSS